MTVADTESSGLLSARARSPKGPVTAARQRRTAIVYGCVCLVGLMPLLLRASPELQAAGLGLWMPGAGFVADGGWFTLLFPLTLLVFVAALVAWFWAGVVLAPLLVWGGACAFAALFASQPMGAAPHLEVAFVMAGVAALFYRRIAIRRISDAKKFAARIQFLPASLSEVQTRSAVTPDSAARELSHDEIASLRYIYDRALQPVREFNGFDVIDQFQPAALRYQLNHMGFALGIAQGSYLPSFTGYLAEAQNNLIQKYLLKRVWDYWVYESCWGHLDFLNFDPAARDNIMLTGWFGMHVGQYMLNSGDRRYAESGSLSFKLTERTKYTHDFHSIIKSVVDNYEHYKSKFCLFPCEPNWIYPICNHYGMTSLVTHDKLFGTDYVSRFLPIWLDKLDTEFTDGAGSIIGLRSKHLGVEVPFPVGEAGYSHFANCFAPDRARRLWAIARREIEPAIVNGPDGKARITLPGRGLDAGNYRSGHSASFGSIMLAAQEFGDTEIAEAALRSLDQDCGLDVRGGVRRYVKGSNLANVAAVMGRIMRTGDFRRSFTEGPSASTLAGPILAEAKYPEVLVARAYSNGDGLDLVLYSATGAGPHRLKLARLKPGQVYWVDGATTDDFVASNDGTADLYANIHGRTNLTVREKR
jgi:hypothetical protein